MATRCANFFLACEQAMVTGITLRRPSRREKEFPFQDWVDARLNETGLHFEQGGRNSYPDFTLVDSPEGFEVKGLEWPGRVADFDANSRVPTGEHRGRTIFYVFGRYPPFDEGTTEYPVTDLVVCHGDFLNADHDYVHKNKSFRGFGTYGDILIRDRKMYVVPTPFALIDGIAGKRLLIVPEGFVSDNRLEEAARLVRVEADDLVTGYTFDLETNELTPQFMRNPNAGKEHRFVAYRVHDSWKGTVSLAPTRQVNT